ncbi:MAG: alpha/beta fold hydrolase [Promethearchaeota archaeon]
MPYFENEGVKIYYEIEGEGPPVIMIHGFASSIEGNWRATNWIEELKDNYRVVLLDCRGHGKSDKPHDEALYGQKMTEDVFKLMEHLSIEKANIFGYSMGAYITFRLLLTKPEQIISGILGGFVLNLMQDDKARSTYIESTKQRIEAFRAENINQVKDPMAREFRQFAELGGNDLLALASVTAGLLKERTETMSSPVELRDSLKKIQIPVMSVVGSNDFLPGDKTLIAQLVPDACHFQIQGKDHLTVVPDLKFKMAVKAFLNYVNKKKQ